MKNMVEILESIEDEMLRKRCTTMYEEFKEQFDFFPASTKYHHSWKGALGQHNKEVMNIALELYDTHPDWYSCTRDEVILATLIHDIEKIDGYTLAEDWQIRKGQMFTYTKRPYVNSTARVVRLCADYGIFLNDRIMNAITFSHGSWSVDLSSPYSYVSSRDILPLGILIHVADLLSSQLLGYQDKNKENTNGDTQSK